MFRFVITAFVFLLAACVSLPQPENGITIRGGSVLDVAQRTITVRSLYICHGQFVAEVEGKLCAKQTIDATGKWLIPGLTDLHVHAWGNSAANNSEEFMGIEGAAKTLEKAGVTSFLDLHNSEAAIFEFRSRQHQGGHLGADAYAAGAAFETTGGMFTRYFNPARIVNNALEADLGIADIAKLKPDFVKISYDHRGVFGPAMNKETLNELLKKAREMGFKSVVHIGNWDDARDAIEGGAYAVTHLYESPIPESLVVLAKKRGTYWIPTLALTEELAHLVDDPSLLADPLLQSLAAKKIIQSYQKVEKSNDVLIWQRKHLITDGANIRKLQQAGIPLLPGTDMGDVGTFVGWSLHRELALMVAAGLSPWEALATATTNAGEFLNEPANLEVGSRGNVLILSASPIEHIWNTTKIERVIHRGRVAW